MNNLPSSCRAECLRDLANAYVEGPSGPHAALLEEILGQKAFAHVRDGFSLTYKTYPCQITLARYMPRLNGPTGFWHEYVLWEAEGTHEAIQSWIPILMPPEEWEQVEPHSACSNCFKKRALVETTTP